MAVDDSMKTAGVCCRNVLQTLLHGASIDDDPVEKSGRKGDVERANFLQSPHSFVKSNTISFAKSLD